jgi:hypothetical protein
MFFVPVQVLCHFERSKKSIEGQRRTKIPHFVRNDIFSRCMAELLLFFFLIASFGSVLSSGLLHAQEDVSYRIIVNVANPDSTLTKDQVSKLFLKKVSRGENGKKVLPVDLSRTSLVRQKFSQEIHGRKVAAVLAYWQSQVFSGRGVPPEEMSTDEEVLNYVRSNLGAIGYVSSAAKLDKVKVVLISEE